MANSLGRELHQPLVALTTTVIVVVVIGFAYWARVVVIPLALAVFLTFILSPAVTNLGRLRMGRAPAVIIVVSSALIVVVLVGGLISWQFTALLRELPDHRVKIAEQMDSMHT